MSDRESIIDNWIERAISFYGKSDWALKLSCINASPVVGKYDGGTKMIADGIRRSPSTVENHAHAHWLYKALRTGKVHTQVRTLWRTLPATHWWHAWGIHQAGYNALHYLTNAAAHGWSVRDMMEEYKRDREAGTAPLVLARAMHTAKGLMADILSHPDGLTREQREAARRVVEVF